MAAETGWAWDESFEATGDLSSYQYYIAKTTGKNTAALCTGSSGGASGPRGVLQNDPSAAGQAAIVRIFGMTKLVAGGAVSIGDLVTCTTGGAALTASTTGQLCIGRANTASTASGQVIECFLFGPGTYYNAGATA